MDARGVHDALARMTTALQKLEQAEGELSLVGIRTGGLDLAQRLATLLSPSAPRPVGAIDIALYRDDVFEGLPRPEVGRTDLPFDLQGRTIVLVDDVLFTGRTIRAALDALMDYGRPKAVRLAVLVDRGHRELPIAADVVGHVATTKREQRVRVALKEHGLEDGVGLWERAS